VDWFVNFLQGYAVTANNIFQREISDQTRNSWRPHIYLEGEALWFDDTWIPPTAVSSTGDYRRPRLRVISRNQGYCDALVAV
jgi:hypothetical protein